MKNLRLFQELEDYTEVANTLKYPTVSHIIYALTHPNQPGIIIIDNGSNDGPIKSGDSR